MTARTSFALIAMSAGASLRGTVRSLFRSAGRVDTAVVIAFILIHALLVLNAMLHPPTMQYDGEGHIQYATVLAQGRLPWSADSKEFFSPPTPYILPALLMGLGGVDPWWAMKAAQLANVVVSAALVVYLLALCELVQPGRRTPKLAALVALGLFPVYFRTFAMVRGEPFVAFFAIAAAYHTLALALRRDDDSSRADTKHAVALGLTLGLATISRQWGFFLIPAVTLFIGGAALTNRARRRSLIRGLVLAGFITAVVGSWWYAGLYVRFGTVTAFNRPPVSFRLSNQPREFYLGSGSGKIFTDPIRPSFPNQLLPTFYSDTWGDYWGYFLVRGIDRRSGEALRPAALSTLQSRDSMPEWLDTNRRSVARYLGRVNLISLLPSALVLVALTLGAGAGWRFLRGRDGRPESAAAALVTLIVLCSALGYFWFVVKYPIYGKGDTIKASYMLHSFPCAALLVGLYAAELAKRWPKTLFALGVAMALVFIHNLPTMISGYVSSPFALRAAATDQRVPVDP